MTGFSLSDLERIVEHRANESAEASYTASLLSRGTEKCAKKFGEESVEAVIAAVTGDKGELVKETADVLFHLLVMLRSQGVTLDQVFEELEARTAQSGHAEKASRKG